MDVSRINAYKPQYDWRNMTAREIIKHDDDGDKVPSMYLQWARDFLNSIESDDVTTYEIATSGNNTLEKQQNQVEGVQTEDNQQPELSKAKQKRKEMERMVQVWVIKHDISESKV